MSFVHMSSRQPGRTWFLMLRFGRRPGVILFHKASLVYLELK